MIDDIKIDGSYSETKKKPTWLTCFGLLLASFRIRKKANKRPKHVNQNAFGNKLRKGRSFKNGTITSKSKQERRNFAKYNVKYHSIRKIFVAKRDEVTGEWKKLHNAELHALYSSPDIITNIKSRCLRWAGHVAYMDESYVFPNSSHSCHYRRYRTYRELTYSTVRCYFWNSREGRSTFTALSSSCARRLVALRNTPSLFSPPRDVTQCSVEPVRSAFMRDAGLHDIRYCNSVQDIPDELYRNRFGKKRYLRSRYRSLDSDKETVPGRGA
ncbi:hypothetical protein ANN_14883 [Periplaneta americana]|uniref:Uncharacterized protein n=1 Tax=Periplaneta americana TaxID=6978 RepID=A0ABQ8SXH5_PERAM|nr:hypothetical protein ANN_14883 [Periplaneta americana]